MTTRLISLAAALAGTLPVFGCATHSSPLTPVGPVPAQRVLSGQWLHPAPGAGRLLLERDGTVTSRACGDEVSLDGVAVAVLAAGERIELYLPPGDHLLTTKSAAMAYSNNVSSMCMGALAERIVTIAAPGPSSYQLVHVEGGELQIRAGAF